MPICQYLDLVDTNFRKNDEIAVVVVIGDGQQRVRHTHIVRLTPFTSCRNKDAVEKSQIKIEKGKLASEVRYT